MWNHNPNRPTFQIDGSTMNIFSRNLASKGDDVAPVEMQPPAGFQSAKQRYLPNATAQTVGANLQVGFASCFPGVVKHHYTEHWVLFPNFRSPRVANEGSFKGPVNPLILESVEPEAVFEGGWKDEEEFLKKVREFLSTRPEFRYIRHTRVDSFGHVP